MRISDLKKKGGYFRPPPREPKVEAATPRPAPVAAPAPALERPVPIPVVETPKTELLPVFVRAQAPEPAPAPRAPEPQRDRRRGDMKELEAQRSAARAAYGRAVALLRSIFAHGAPALSELQASLGELIGLMLSGNEQLLALTECVSPGETLAAHSVNVAILSLVLGAAMKIEKEALETLGLSALLHDLGKAPTYRLALDSTLKPEEAERLKRRIVDAAAHVGDLTGGLDELGRALARNLSQVHGGPEMDTAAQIISLCDAFEALTHGYEGRPALHPCVAFKTLVSLKAGFDRLLVKRLLESVSPFPPGSLIELADGRVGAVVSVNRKMLTRPVVELWAHSDGRAHEPNVFVDLARESLTGVTGVPDAKRLANPVVAGRLLSQRSWVEGD